MSQIIFLPAASHEFNHVATPLFIFTYSFLAESSISKSLAFTRISLFSTNLLAVSLTTANAFGNISLRVCSLIS